MILSVGTDHAGFKLKAPLIAHLEKLGHTILDHGCYQGETVDFPVVAKKVCAAVLEGRAQRGLMICGSGVGACIACNKISGIRASCCHDLYSARQCVEHDDVNVACVGADVVGAAAACDLIERFLSAEFFRTPEFAKRVEMLEHMDRERQ